MDKIEKLKTEYFKNRDFNKGNISMDDPKYGFIAYLIHKIDTREDDIIANVLANCRVEDGKIIYNPN